MNWKSSLYIYATDTAYRRGFYCVRYVFVVVKVINTICYQTNWTVQFIFCFLSTVYELNKTRFMNTPVLYKLCFETQRQGPIFDVNLSSSRNWDINLSSTSSNRMLANPPRLGLWLQASSSYIEFNLKYKPSPTY